MKNKFLINIILLTLLTLSQSAFSADETFFGIGAELFQDPFNKKVVVTKIISGSPSERVGLTEGSEIISIDGKKARKMACLCEIISRVRGEKDTNVELVVRKGWKWKKIKITREQIKYSIPDENPGFDKYWRQVCPEKFRYSKFIPEEITNKFSLKYKRKILPSVNYWVERKSILQEGYNTCMSYSKNNQELCLINLLNRENEKTLTDKKLFKFLRK